MQKCLSSVCVAALIGAMVLNCGCRKDAKTPEPQAADRGGKAIAPEADGDAVLVTVNGKTLDAKTATRIVRETAMRQRVPPELLDAYVQQAADELRKEAVEQFIDRTLLEAEVARRQIALKDGAVDNVISGITSRLPEGLSLADVLKKEGMTEEQLREEVAGSERMRMVYEAETAKIPAATEEQVESYYNQNPDRFKVEEQVEASHILVGVKSDAPAEERAAAKASAEEIRKQLVAGGDFAALAKEKSSCPSKEAGGKLGRFGRGRMVPAFDQAAFSQGVGEIGPVVESDFGYHIIKVTDKTAAKVQPLADAREMIRDMLTMTVRQEAFGGFLKSLRNGAAIAYAPGMAPAAK